MKAFVFASAMFLAFGLRAGIAAPAAAEADLNLSAFANGALIESATSEYGETWQARWLTDENPQSGWSTGKAATGPFSIVISLPESSEIHSLEFDAMATESPERTAKDIDVLVSATSATVGFTKLTGVALKSGLDKQHFDLDKPGVGRWIKLIINSNHGDAEYSQLMEFRALGKQLTQSAAPTVDSDHLRANAKPAIDELLGALKADPTGLVGIEGHTDATGNAAHNLDLSQRRAASVKAALVAAGIAADLLTTSGAGQSKPIASNDTAIGRAQNRRVEVVKQ